MKKCVQKTRDREKVCKEDSKFYLECGELDVLKRKILGGNW